MSIQLTNKNGSYSKRIMPLELTICTFLNVLPSNAINAIRDAVSFVRCGRYKEVFMSECGSIEHPIAVYTNHSEDCCALCLFVSHADGVVRCSSTITLKFPSLRSVLEYEHCLSTDQKAFEEKYGEWLK